MLSEYNKPLHDNRGIMQGLTCWRYNEQMLTHSECPFWEREGAEAIRKNPLTRKKGKGGKPGKTVYEKGFEPSTF